MLITLFRTILLFTLVIIILRLMGKRQIGELQPFELVVTLLLSELAAIPMSSSDLPLLSGIIPMLILLLGQLTLSWWTLKNARIRGIICGRPSVLIEKGRILEDELLKIRLNLTDLLELLRIQGYSDISQLDYVIMETCGQISVVPKPAYRPVTLRDLSLPFSAEATPTIPLILDGELQPKGMLQANLSQADLQRLLQAQGVQRPQEVFYAALNEQGQLIIQKKAGV
jgi:uncharacterized membrane protein YcaP (DUF421 family)